MCVAGVITIKQISEELYSWACLFASAFSSSVAVFLFKNVNSNANTTVVNNKVVNIFFLIKIVSHKTQAVCFRTTSADERTGVFGSRWWAYYELVLDFFFDQR
jgi:hypothetical protein